MPVKIPSSLPAVEILKAENIFVMDDLRASAQDIRPLKLLILNLMPLKIVTETDLLRLISNTPLQIELDFMSVSGHISRNTPLEHIDTFYKDFDEIRSQNYDGMIITGAPVETVRGGRLLERVSRDFRLGAQTRYLDSLYLLGCFGRAVPFLRNPQIPVG